MIFTGPYWSVDQTIWAEIDRKSYSVNLVANPLLEQDSNMKSRSQVKSAAILKAIPHFFEYSSLATPLFFVCAVLFAGLSAFLMKYLPGLNCKFDQVESIKRCANLASYANWVSISVGMTALSFFLLGLKKSKIGLALLCVSIIAVYACSKLIGHL